MMQELANLTQNIKINQSELFHQNGYVSRFNVWLSHQLNQKKIYRDLFKCSIFLKVNVTDDDLYIFAAT